MTDDRYERGMEKLLEVDGKAGLKAIEDLKAIAPDLGRMLVEFPFGDIYSRPGLDKKSREIAAIASLTAMGGAEQQLKVHVHAALNIGCSRTEVVETILQMTVYCGFPRAINAMYAAKAVFEKRDAKGRS